MRKLSEIAAEIEANRRSVNNGAARSALEQMITMGFIGEPHYFDRNGAGVVGRFLCNVKGWRGPIARRVKNELRAMWK